MSAPAPPPPPPPPAGPATPASTTLTKKQIKDAIIQMFAASPVLPIAARTQIPTALNSYAATHNVMIRDVLQNMTADSVHGLTTALRTYTGPSTAVLHQALGHITGYNVAGVEARLADYIFKNVGAFWIHVMDQFYSDDADGLMYARFEVNGALVTDDAENMRLRMRARIQHVANTAPETLIGLVNGAMDWDAATNLFVQRPALPVAPVAPVAPVLGMGPLSAVAVAPTAAPVPRVTRSAPTSPSPAMVPVVPLRAPKRPMMIGPVAGPPPKRPRPAITKRQCTGRTVRGIRCRKLGYSPVGTNFLCLFHRP